MYQDYLSLRGRSARLPFLKLTILGILVFALMCLALAVIFFVIILTMSLFGNDFLERPENQYVFDVAIVLSSLPFYYFNVVIAVRRLHDLNLSGWWLLLFILISFSLELIVTSNIPIYVFGLLQLAALLLVPGTDGPNRFGPKPDVSGSVPPDNGSAASVGTPA